MSDSTGRKHKAAPKRPKDPEGRMPLMDHLRELRNRLVKSLVVILLATCVAAYFYKDIATFLVHPVCELKHARGTGQTTECGNGVLVQQGVLDPFSMMLKVSLVTGIVAASPVWAWQFWAFLAPGLHRNEKRYTVAFVGVGVPLFLAGAYFSYMILPHALPVLLDFTPGDVSNQLLLGDYLTFVLRMVVVFGLACELPLVLVLLNFGGVVTARQLAGWWRWVVMGIFVFGAVATPTTDPLTMCLLSVPITLLYVLALGVCWLNDRRRGRHRRERLGAEVPDDEASTLDLTPGSIGHPSAPEPADGTTALENVNGDGGVRVDDIT